MPDVALRTCQLPEKLQLALTCSPNRQRLDVLVEKGRLQERGGVLQIKHPHHLALGEWCKRRGQTKRELNPTQCLPSTSVAEEANAPTVPDATLEQVSRKQSFNRLLKLPRVTFCQGAATRGRAEKARWPERRWRPAAKQTVESLLWACLQTPTQVAVP